MSVKIFSGTYSNFSGNIIEVEINISKGIPCFNIVGLPDTSIKESKDRVRASIENSGYKFPLGRITVNLAPADIKKIGSLLDLPIAIGILIESNQIKGPKEFEKIIILGELSLNGDIKSINGFLPIALYSLQNGYDTFIFPQQNLKECSYINNSKLYPFCHLKEVISFFEYRDISPYICKTNHIDKKISEDIIDFKDIIGQNSAKRAMVIAASGHHNIVLYGSTGCGKTMLSNAFQSIMPDLSIKDQMEIAKVYSYAGHIDKISLNRPPFRRVHHTASKIALTGGGHKASLQIGEYTLADKGVLFLDELLEFKKSVLETLREPLEDGCININRLDCSIRLPSNFILLGTFNLCPCGNKKLGYKDTDSCSCTSSEIKKYLARLSKAIRDRIDIYSYVPNIKYQDIYAKYKDESLSSSDMKQIVLSAIDMQKQRLRGTKYIYNSDIRGKDIFELCRVTSKINDTLCNYFNESLSSIRSYGKIIKLARTIADIKSKQDISQTDVLEAIEYRKDYTGEIY